jgi:hypothetical protein
MQWKQILDMHSSLATNRLAFADKLQQVANECGVNDKNAERERKQLKESAMRFEREMLDGMKGYERAEKNYFTANQEWERCLQTQNQSQPAEDGIWLTMQPQGTTFAQTLKKLPGLVKTSGVDKARQGVYHAKERAVQANIAYQNQIGSANSLRRRFFQEHVPRIIRVCHPLWMD